MDFRETIDAYSRNQMPMPTVEHLGNVSFKDHFLSAQEAAPKNGSIQVNSAGFDIMQV